MTRRSRTRSRTSSTAIVERARSDLRPPASGLRPRPAGGLLRRVVSELSLRTLGPDFGERIEALKRDTNEFGVDAFGIDPEVIRTVGLVAAWLYRCYFRVEARGLERVPPGRVLLVSNHSGQIPLDGAMIAMAALLDGEEPRVVRTMVERWSPTIPFVSILFSRTGQVVGMPENARRLLEAGHGILVFPEGSAGCNKPYSKAYQLQAFGLGFMRLALETQTPIVPVAVVGAEEQYPAIHDFKGIARLVGAPALPVTPFMLLPVIGLLPLPVKYRITFGEPMEFDGDPDDDDAEIDDKVQVVRSTIQRMINRGLKDRERLFW